MTKLERNQEFIKILDFVLNNCPSYDPSCEAKDCCECEEGFDYALYVYREVMIDKAVEEHLEWVDKDMVEHPENYDHSQDPPLECVWGCTHCALKDTDNCKIIINEGKKNESNK